MSEQDDYYDESIVIPGTIHFRLRINNGIVGFKRVHNTGLILFSRDNFWWTNRTLSHLQEDRSSELFDANRQMIFEHDAVHVRTENGGLNGIVIFNDAESYLEIRLADGSTHPLSPMDATAPFCDHIKVTGQAFTE